MKQELEDIKSALKQDPRNARALKNLGRFYLNNFCFKRAREEFNLAANFNPRLVSEILLDHETLIEKAPENSSLRLSLASFLLYAEDNDSAILELEELLDVDPASPKIYNLLGKLYLGSNRIDEAIVLLERALALGIKDIGISQMLAGVYLEKGRLKEAVKFYNELHELSPQDKNVIRTLGELNLRIGEYEEAAGACFKLFKLDPESAVEVVKKLEEILLFDETSIKTREILAEVYMKSVKPDRAAEKLNQILLLDPSKIDFVIEKNKKILKSYPNHPQALLNLASVQIEKGNFSEAIENFEKLIKNDPALTPGAVAGCKRILEKYPDQYLAHQFLCEVFLREENWGQAIKQLRMLLELHNEAADWTIDLCRDAAKTEPRLLECVGYAYLKKDDLIKAAGEAEGLLSAVKDYAPGWVLLGKINLKKNLSRKAREAFESALNLAPGDKEIHALLKQAYFCELMAEEQSIKKRLAEDERRFSLNFELAKVYVKLERHDDAIKELQIAVRDQARSPYVYNLMAELYIEDGRFNLAQSVILKALEDCGDPAVNKKLKFNLACCFEAQGNIKKAVKILEDIQSTDLNLPGLAQKIKFLKESSLNSLQNKMLALVIFNSSSRKTYSVWGRESKSSFKRPNITASFGQSHNNDGFEYYLKGMFKAAQEEFDLAAKIDPALLPAANNLGVVYLESGRKIEAIQKFKDALRIDPASSIILNNLAIACFLENDLENALKYCALAVKAGGDFSPARINLGDLAYAADEAEKALNEWRAVKSFDLLYPLAQKRLAYKTV